MVLVLHIFRTVIQTIIFIYFFFGSPVGEPYSLDLNSLKFGMFKRGKILVY